MAITTTVKNGNVDAALKIWKQKTAKSGVLKEARLRQEGYEKPGVKKRKAKKEGIKNTKQREKKNK